MDLTSNDACIISAGIGGWYPNGIDRLERSLIYVGSPFPHVLWKDYPEGCPSHNDVPYYFKIAAFEHALKAGYRKVLWVDASFWVVNTPMPVFDIINDQGYYMFSSGFSIAETCSDRVLDAVGITRDAVDGVTEWASGAVGINFDNPDGVNIYTLWKQHMDAGYSIGSRLHDNQSADPRFRWHRQDQTCLALAMHQLGLRNERGLDHVAYYSTNYNPEQVIFFIKGI